MIETERLILRPWIAVDADDFAALHADPEVMWDYGAPIDREKSDIKFAFYRSRYDETGVTRWAVETRDGGFLGFTGMLLNSPEHPLGVHFDIGWRLHRAAWGKGYATEAATAALADFAIRKPGAEVLAYTKAINMRSRAVMDRLGLTRDAARDYTYSDEHGDWPTMVWKI